MPATIRGERFNQDVPHYHNLAVDGGIGSDRDDLMVGGCVLCDVEMDELPESGILFCQMVRKEAITFCLAQTGVFSTKPNPMHYSRPCLP